MLAEIKSVGFKVENFDRENMGTLEAAWPAVSQALRITAQLVADFGYTSQTLTAPSCRSLTIFTVVAPRVTSSRTGDTRKIAPRSGAG